MLHSDNYIQVRSQAYSHTHWGTGILNSEKDKKRLKNDIKLNVIGGTADKYEELFGASVEGF